MKHIFIYKVVSTNTQNVVTGQRLTALNFTKGLYISIKWLSVVRKCYWPLFLKDHNGVAFTIISSNPNQMDLEYFQDKEIGFNKTAPRLILRDNQWKFCRKRSHGAWSLYLVVTWSDSFLFLFVKSRKSGRFLTLFEGSGRTDGCRTRRNCLNRIGQSNAEVANLFERAYT